MTYQKEIKEWLSAYKQNHFKGLEDGKWKRNNKKYPHILPESPNFMNLLPTYRDSFCNSDLCKIKYHPDFHHLNSSQAMCINFFYPFIKENKLDVILQALKLQNDSKDYNSVCFEKESQIEKNSRPTSFDFYIQTIKKKEIHFEIKYTEGEFGKAKLDQEHFDKYDNIYKHHLSNFKSEYTDRDSFLKNYQLMRNLIHLAENSYVVFVYPKDNKKISKQAEDAKDNIVKSEFKSNVINITWEQLIEFVENKITDSNELSQQIKDFKEKYFITK